MTTTNMFLNFGGKWDSPPLKRYEANLGLGDIQPQKMLLSVARQ